jgi:hypothetical protein
METVTTYKLRCIIYEVVIEAIIWQTVDAIFILPYVAVKHFDNTAVIYPYPIHVLMKVIVNNGYGGA